MSYLENGYTVVKNAVDITQVISVINDMQRVVALRVLEELKGWKVEPSAHSVLKYILDRDPGEYTSLLSFASRLEHLRGVLCSPTILSELKNFYGCRVLAIASDPVLHVLANDLHVPGGYFGTAAHQDWPSTQGSLDSITVWIPFTETKDNFPLEVIPGSHKWGLLPGKENGSVLEVQADDNQFIALECSPGDVVFLSAFLVHRTGRGGDGLRVAASARFDNPFEMSFGRRSFPCAQRRVVDREIKWKPSVEQVRAVFGG